MANSDAGRFHLPALAPARTLEQFAVHMAAVEWSLDSPITIQGEKDIQSRRTWEERVQPYAHQIQNLITFCRRAPVALLADDVGLGKTISAGLILSELATRRKVSRTLIVAPRSLLPQWQEELAEKFKIPSKVGTGQGFSFELSRRPSTIITTYQSIHPYMSEIAEADFDMVIFDEAHKLRNLHGTKSGAPKVASSVRKLLADRAFKYVLMLTATPIQNRLWDLYSLVDLLTVAKGHVNPLGSPESFRRIYVSDARAVQLQPGRREEFRRHISNYIVRTRRADAKLVFPERQVKTYKVEPSAMESALLRLVARIFNSGSLNGLAQSSIGQALMSSPDALASQLETMAGRLVPTEVAKEARKLVSDGGIPSKLSGLGWLIDELKRERPDWRLIVFTSRKETQRAIGRYLKTRDIPTGFIAGGEVFQNERSIKAFRTSPPGVHVLVSTDAGAEGLNLQVANVLVNFDLPWNPMVLEQRIGRIQRLASTHAEVKVLNFVLSGSVEEAVVARLAAKLQAISESIGDIEGILESMGDGEDDDSFEAMIRKLVVDSLRGINVEAAATAAAQSIQRAKEIFEEERAVVETTLGDLQDLHRTGPRVPEISPVVPSIDAQSFVLRALRADGAKIEAVSGGRHQVHLPGQNEFILSFDDVQSEDERGAIFGGNAPRPYVPGKRHFERLAQTWADKCRALVRDRNALSTRQVEAAVSNWLQLFDGFHLKSYTEVSKHSGFVGEVTWKASAKVEHDRLEKLVKVPISFGPLREVQPALESESISAELLALPELESDDHGVVMDAVAAHPDLSKFVDFYNKRLADELSHAKGADSEARVRGQFTPTIAAEAIAATGIRYAITNGTAMILIDGCGPYAAEFEVRPGVRGELAARPLQEWSACDLSGRVAPPTAFGNCVLTGKRVLLHLLAASAESGKLALPSQMIQCQVSGALVLPDELQLCAVTGLRARLGALAKSAVSGKSVLPYEIANCELTGTPVLPNELAVSDVSGRKYRIDQTVRSTVSGRCGHLSEYVESELPKGLIARDEAEKSDVSGVWAAKDRLLNSELAPARKGLPSEIVESRMTGRRILTDEGGKSEISGSWAERSELARCEITSVVALPSELNLSQISGRRYRADQSLVSALSGRQGHVSEFVQSVAPSGWIARDEAAQSAVSGEWGARESLRQSSRPPHRLGLQHEVVRCEMSGQALLRDEVESSAVSGKLVDRLLLVPSAASGRLAISEELFVCEATGRRLLPDEVGRCALTGKMVDLRELEASAVSGIRALRAQMIRSPESERYFLPAECARCAVSGMQVGNSELQACAITGRLAITRLMQACPTTGRLFIADGESSKQLREIAGRDEFIVQCNWTGKRVLANLLQPCAITSLRVLPDVLNPAGELADLRVMLNGGANSDSIYLRGNELERVRLLDPTWKYCSNVRVLPAPSKQCWLLVIRLQTGFLGLRTTFVAVATEPAPGLRPISKPVAGRLVGAVWTRQ